MGAECDVEILKGYPYLINNESLAEKIKNNSAEYVGKGRVEDLELRMTAEDFSYFAQKHPSVLYRLGTGNTTKGTTEPLHSEKFNIDEEALLIGTGLMTWNVISLLNS